MDSSKFYQEFQKKFEEYERTLRDDEEFCSKDLDATGEHLTNLEKKFAEKIQAYRTRLEQLRLENQQMSEKNRQDFQEEAKTIELLCRTERYTEAKRKIQEYENRFENRSQILQRIPQCSLTVDGIEQAFPLEIIETERSLPLTVIEKKESEEEEEEKILTTKEKLRREKKFETTHFDQEEDFGQEKSEEVKEKSRFGILSKQQPRPIEPPSQRKYAFSTRLVTPTPKQVHISINPNLILNPVTHYNKHERNKLLLMACNYNYIVLFRSQPNYLGAFERRTHNEQTWDWHEGLIISMGCIDNDRLYMFTEFAFLIYSIAERRQLDSRILKQGTEEYHDINQYQRGIGTVFSQHVYHIYLNKSSHWTLTRMSLSKLLNLGDYDLTRLYPDVRRFIHLCINDKTWNFLVEMNDSTYAVVYCSLSDFHLQQPHREIRLENAQKPLTIYSTFNQSLRGEIFFINDPSARSLHVITLEKYLHSYSLDANAICSVGEKNELMIITNNSISSINFNEQNIVLATEN